jgi:hypothetical protein
MLRTGQGGSVLSFILGGLLLVAILIGGIYFFHQKNKYITLPQTQTTDGHKQEPAIEKPPRATPPVRETKEQSTQPSTPSAAPQLPETGQEVALGSMFTLALLSYVIISYIQSRRVASL